jgi:iron(III) transport system substrate-binding protein
MKTRTTVNILLIVISSLITRLDNAAAASNEDRIVSNKQADAKGYTFFLNRDEIVAKAKQEGKLRAFSGLREAMNAVVVAFRKKYPFIETSVEEWIGTDTFQRTLLELKAGKLRGLDVIRAPSDFYNDYLPYVKKVDLLGMAKSGILNIPVQMIDPNSRNVVAILSKIQIAGYNKNLIPDDRVPGRWEDYLKPEFKGKKFIADIRPTEIASLVPAWGLEKTLDFARKIAAQNPVWSRGDARAMASLAAGEYALYLGANYDLIITRELKSPIKSLGYKIMEPVPTRVSEESGILETAENPHASILWIEFLASPEGQRIIDKYKPGSASLFSSDSMLSAETKGKRLSVVQLGEHAKMQEWQRKISEAYGFPRAESQ